MQHEICKNLYQNSFKDILCTGDRQQFLSTFVLSFSVFNLVSDLQQGIQSKYVKKVFKKCPIKAYNKCVSFHFMGEWLVTWNKFSGLSEITSNLLISIDTNSHGMTLTNFYTDGHNGWIKLEWGYPKTPKGTPIARLGGSDTSRNINFI